MKHLFTCLALTTALVAPVALAGPGKYPVKKDAVNPDYENGQIWDAEHIEADRDSLMTWCRTAGEHGTKVIVDYKSFEDAFDFEMTHKKKVRERLDVIAPWNACDHLCGLISLEGNLMIEGLPTSQFKPAAAEMQAKVKTLKCTYRNPAEGVKTHVEYDAKTKTLTGFMTWGKDTTWEGWSWGTSAWDSPTFKKEFPVITKWKEEH